MIFGIKNHMQTNADNDMQRYRNWPGVLLANAAA